MYALAIKLISNLAFTNKKLAFMLLLFAMALSACQPGPQELGGNPDQVTSATSISPTPIVPTPTQELVDFLYAGFTDLLTANVETGVWTEGQGLVQLLKLFTGELNSDDVIGAALVQEGEGTMLITLASEYILTGEEQDVKDDLTRLIKLIFPTQEQLDRFSVPFDEEGAVAARKLAAPAIQGPEGCEEMWRDGFVNDNFPCFLRKEASVDGQTYGVYIPAAMSESAHFDAALEALVMAAEKYKDYGTIQDATILFSMLGLPGAARTAATTNIGFNVNSAACPIVVYPATVENTSIDVFQQVVAHEMFHCFQVWNARTALGFADNQWWIEGSAEYFSNLVYPSTNIEHRFLDKLDARSTNKSLVKLSYENFLFFQFLGNKIQPKPLADLLTAMARGGGGYNSQMRILKQLSGDENIYQSFGKAFIDGTIADSDSNIIPKASKYTETITIKTLTQESFDAAPYVLTRILLTYEVRMKFVQQVLMEEPGKYTVRKFSTPGEWDILKERIYTFCSENKFIVLVTNEEMGSGKKTLHLNVFETDDMMWNMDIGLGEKISGKTATFSPIPFGAGLYGLIMTEDPIGTNEIEFYIARVTTFGEIWGGYFDLNANAWDVMAFVTINELTDDFMLGTFTADFFIKDSFDKAFSGSGTFGACSPSKIR